MDISERIRYVGVNDLDKVLFESQWPLKHGISYNSYLVVDEKIALIDTVDIAFKKEFYENIRSAIGERTIDYLVVNHMEPDHSALISFIRSEYPNIEIVMNPKAVPMINGFQGITDNITAVKDGDELNLGHTTLRFYAIPMVHWPETMVTYCVEEKTAFSGDAFGSFGSVKNCITDTSCDTYEKYQDEMIRYYSNIVGKFGQPVQNALKKLSSLELKRICPTHGPVWETHLKEVVALYDKMSRYETEKGVCIVYGSMYGNTEKAALSLADELKSRGVKYAIHNLSFENPSYAYEDVFKYNIIAAGAPTYNNDIFPPVRHFLYGVCSRFVRNHSFFSFGSYSWAGGSVKLMDEMMAAHGFCILTEGLAFKQGYRKEECDMGAVADLIKQS